MNTSLSDTTAMKAEKKRDRNLLKPQRRRITFPANLARVFDAGAYTWNILIVFLSSATTLIIWFNYGEFFDEASIRQIWQARHAPQTLYQHLLSPVALYGDFPVVIFITVVTTLILWLFASISALIGIGRKTFFVLFVLLNFSPEFNKERLVADPYMISVLLWLAAVWWFIRWYRGRLYLAFLGWAMMMWLGGLFSVTSVVWALGFPLCFLFWPGSGTHWWKLLAERGRFLVIYYLLIGLFVLVVPQWRGAIAHMIDMVDVQFHAATLEISLFLSNDNNFSLAVSDAFLIALVLVTLNALKVASVLIVFVLWLSCRRYVSSVLVGRVKLFFIFCLAFSLVSHAFSLLYSGYLQSSRHYLPVLMLLLWLSAGGAYFALQRLLSGRLRPEYLLVAAWFLVAYALASMLQFGPNRYYQREAGQWSAAHPVAGKVLSNSASVLYYAGESPFADDPNLLSFSELALLGDPLAPSDRYIMVHSLKTPLPEKIHGFTVVRRFSNGRNNAAYIIEAKPSSLR